MKIRNQFILMLAVLFAFGVVAKAQTTNTINEEQPKVVKAFAPKYPPAARAVSDTKDYEKVVVKVNVNADGKVVSADAKSGHILLKKPSEKAALRWQFNAIGDKKQKRTLEISFIYRLDGDIDNPETFFNPPFEVEIISGKNIIYTNSNSLQKNRD